MYLPRIALSLGVLGMVGLTNMASAEDTLTPGLYQTNVKVEAKMGDMQLPTRDRQQKDCITAEDIANGPPVAMPDDSSSECQVQEYEMGGGQFSMRMSCTVQGGEGTMVGSGTYTDDSFEMTNEMNVSMQGINMRMTSKSTGKRIGSC